jgi:hypothetical protein
MEVSLTLACSKNEIFLLSFIFVLGLEPDIFIFQSYVF